MSAAAALVTVFFIVDFPDQVTFLTAAEKELLHRRLELDNKQNMDRLDRQSLMHIVTDYKIWMTQVDPDHTTPHGAGLAWPGPATEEATSLTDE